MANLASVDGAMENQVVNLEPFLLLVSEHVDFPGVVATVEPACLPTFAFASGNAYIVVGIAQA